MSTQPPTPRYWFPAKRYGWGWGLPSRWQGWVVMGIWLGLVIAGSVVIAGRHLGWYFVYMGMLVAMLIAVCWIKGAPPRWRWGDDSK